MRRHDLRRDFRQEEVSIDAAHAFAYFQEAAAAQQLTPGLVNYLL
jgi:hypothetical protein